MPASIFPSPGFLGQLFRQPLDFLLPLVMSRLQFLDSRLQLRPFGRGTLLVRPSLFLCVLKFLLQTRLRLFVPGQFSFQFTPAFANLARLLLGPFPALGLLGQRFRQPLDLLLHLGLRRL